MEPNLDAVIVNWKIFFTFHFSDFQSLVVSVGYEKKKSHN